MSKKIVYVVTGNPKEKGESISAVFGQALTAISFGYECDIFLMGDGILVAKQNGLDGIKSAPFEPVADLLEAYMEMDGKLFVCIPAMEARKIPESEFMAGVQFVNASVLLEKSLEADVVFNY